ncbi:hypothetical protein ABC855_g580 [[Candida] zeylanoides]
MNDNFWFNDNAFSGGAGDAAGDTAGDAAGDAAPDDDFLTNLFDKSAPVPARPSHPQMQAMQPPYQAAMSPEGAMAPVMPQMYQQAPQAAASPMAGPTAPDARLEAKREQLLKMRQQITQQQMLAKQKPMGEFAPEAPVVPPTHHSPQLAMKAYPRADSAGTPQSFNAAYPQSIPQMPQMPQMSQSMPQSQPQPSQSMPQSQPQPSQSQPQSQPQQSPTGTPGQSQPPSGAQLAQMQMELFLTTLYDFMARRGSPISPPVINNKKVNLFLLYYMCQKLGGSQQLLKAFQNPLPANSPWTLIAQKLGLFEGIDVQNPQARMRVEREVASCFVKLLLPYEQYSNTPEGNRDIHQRKLQFQKQIMQRMQQQQQQQQQMQASGSQMPPQRPPSQQQPKQLSRHTSSQNSPMVTQTPHTQSPGITPGMAANSPALSSAPTPQQRKASRISAASNHASPTVQQRAPSIASEALAAPDASAVGTPTAAARGPTAIREYVPMRRTIDTHGGRDIRALSQVAGEIEITKPVYLFAPEIGSISIHALVMSLKTFSGVASSEVSSALNTLLVTTSDANLGFKLADCPELLDALSILGLKVLDVILQKSKGKRLYEDGDNLPTNSKVDDVFNAYKRRRPDSEDGLVDEDIELVVNSLTGEVVDGEDDDESEAEEDGESLFSSNGDAGSPATPQFAIADYMTNLQEFRKENKHHFSRIQTKSANDDQVMFVDQLITVTMVLRNISFAESNKLVMASSSVLRDLVFAIVKAIASNPQRFVFHRKILCLLKDCLLMVNKTAFNMELRSLEEAFLIFVLLTSFGPQPGEAIAHADLDDYSYLPFAVDAFTKLLVREPHNRSLLQAVLTGSVANAATFGSTSTNGSVQLVAGGGGNASPLVITEEDQRETARLTALYLGGNPSETALPTRAFKFFLSVMPVHLNNFELTKFYFQRSPTVTQALFGAKLVLDLVSTGPASEVTSLRLLPAHWLLDNEDALLGNLLRSSLALIGDTTKIPRRSDEHHVLSLVILKSLILVNSMISTFMVAKSNFATRGALEAEEEEVLKSGAALKDLPRIIPETTLALDALLNPGVDHDVGKEVIRLQGMLRELAKSE